MIAALVGNTYAESSSNPASYGNMSGMFNYGYEVAGGLFQWTDAGSSASNLSSSGFSGLVEYAAEQGKDWTDETLQIDYFLKTWREDWQERPTYYDGAAPEFANVDVSLAAFDESQAGDFDGDGINDAQDSDIDGDGINDANDIVIARSIDGETVLYEQSSQSASASDARTEEEKQRHVAELTFIFMASCEGPSASVCHIDTRVAHAQRMYPAIVALQEAKNQGMSSNAALVVASAEAMLGGTYVWGAESPSSKTFDCSGLTKWCYSLIGVDMDHYSETQYTQADAVHALSEAVPGDILWKPGHVAIYIGAGKTVEAMGTNYGIVYGDASRFAAALHFNVLDAQQPVQQASEQQVELKSRVRPTKVAEAFKEAIKGIHL